MPSGLACSFGSGFRGAFSCALNVNWCCGTNAACLDLWRLECCCCCCCCCCCGGCSCCGCCCCCFSSCCRFICSCRWARDWGCSSCKMARLISCNFRGRVAVSRTMGALVPAMSKYVRLMALANWSQSAKSPSTALPQCVACRDAANSRARSVDAHQRRDRL